MTDVVAAVPAFWLLAGASLVALVGEIVLLVAARARLARQESASRLAAGGDWQAAAGLPSPSRGWEIAAALIPFALAAAFASAIHHARGSIVRVLDAPDPGVKAAAFGSALAAELNTTPFGLLAVMFTAGLGCVAVGLAIGARLRARGLRRAAALAPGAPGVAAAWAKFPGPSPGAIMGSIAAFLVLGCGPIARAAFGGVIMKIKAFASTPGPDKAALVSRALDDAGAMLDKGLAEGRIGVAVAFVIAALLTWKLSAARARARLPGSSEPAPPGDNRTGVVVAGGAIAVAVAAFLAAQPLRRENRLPWPPFDGGERLLSVIATPDLDGPDQLERAPVVHVTPDHMGLDGREADAEALESMLGTLANNYRLLQPDSPYNKQVIIVCQADTTVARLVPALRAALNSSCSRPLFVFLKRQETDRPLLGRRWRNIARAARTTAIDDRRDAEDGASIIDAARFRTCTDLSREIVSARRAGHEVALLLPPDPAAR